MQGVERAHCNAAIQAVLAAATALWNSTVEEALRHVLRYGKSDTLGLDAMSEITIVEQLLGYDAFSVVITEETGGRHAVRLEPNDWRRSKSIFISDPTDRSAQLKGMLEGVDDRTRRVIDVLSDVNSRRLWEEKFGGPAEITGSTSAITCIRRGVPIFAVIVNHLTRELFVSCSAGNFVLSLPDNVSGVDLDYVRDRGRKLFFRGVDSANERRFVTFMGKSGYRENFMDSGFMTEAEMCQCLFYNLPGGPARVFYLSALQPPTAPIGFILANGEKVSEWVHWLPFVRFAREENDQEGPALRLFEVCQDRPWTKDGVLMSTPPAYSLFAPVGEGDRGMVVSVGRFADFPNPCRFRSTLVVAPVNNRWATRVVNQYGFRPIKFFESD
jgi:hypothetical protein